jgi:two-component system response regulator HydG
MGGKLLIVDDDAGMCETLSDILVDHGFQVREALSGAEGLSLLKAELFQAVLLDINMPEMNGAETLREMKKIQPGLKAVVITAYARDEILLRAEEEGVVEILMKPLDIPRLLRLLERTVG